MKFFIIFGIIKWIDMFVPRFVASNPLSAQICMYHVLTCTSTKVQKVVFFSLFFPYMYIQLCYYVIDMYGMHTVQ